MTGVKYASKKYNNKKYLSSLRRTQGVYTQKADKYNRLGAKPHPFRCTKQLWISMSNNATKPILFDYCLDDFGTYGTSLANLFDQYKLVGMKAKLLSMNPTDFLNYGDSYGMALIFNALDYGHYGSGTEYNTADEILQLDTCMISRADQHWTRYFRPRISATNETNNYPTIYEDNPYLASNTTAVKWLGHKLLFEPPWGVIANLQPIYYMFNTYFWLFKNQNS